MRPDHPVFPVHPGDMQGPPSIPEPGTIVMVMVAITLFAINHALTKLKGKK